MSDNTIGAAVYTDPKHGIQAFALDKDQAAKAVKEVRGEQARGKYSDLCDAINRLEPMQSLFIKTKSKSATVSNSIYSRMRRSNMTGFRLSLVSDHSLMVTRMPSEDSQPHAFREGR